MALIHIYDINVTNVWSVKKMAIFANDNLYWL